MAVNSNITRLEFHKPLNHALWLLLDGKDTDSGIQHIFHHPSLSCSIGFSSRPSAMKYSENIWIPFCKPAHFDVLGINITISPTLFMNTSSSEKQYSLGSLTAYLLPFSNILAVVIMSSSLVAKLLPSIPIYNIYYDIYQGQLL